MTSHEAERIARLSLRNDDLIGSTLRELDAEADRQLDAIGKELNALADALEAGNRESEAKTIDLVASSLAHLQKELTEELHLGQQMLNWLLEDLENAGIPIGKLRSLRSSAKSLIEVGFLLNGGHFDESVEENPNLAVLLEQVRDLTAELQLGFADRAWGPIWAEDEEVLAETVEAETVEAEPLPNEEELGFYYLPSSNGETAEPIYEVVSLESYLQELDDEESSSVSAAEAHTQSRLASLEELVAELEDTLPLVISPAAERALEGLRDSSTVLREELETTSVVS